jgi:hypothetical protein
MIPAVLALYCVAAPAAFLTLVFLAGLVGRKLGGGEFSWGRYGAWLGGALVFAVLCLAATTTWMFLVVSFLLVTWVLLRAAFDAQATTLREKIGFLQLYAGLSLVEYGAMSRAGALVGTRAAKGFAFAVHDYVGHLVLPIPSFVIGGASLPPWAKPGALAGHVADSLATHWLLAVALATFGTAAYAYAYFAEHATPKVGLSLLPAPTAVTLAFAAIWVVGRGVPKDGVLGFGLSLAQSFLAPFFVAEGLWVLYRLAAALRTRSLWVGLVAAASVVLPAVLGVLAGLGWAFHLVRLRAFEPILGDVQRSASRPRLRTALAASVVTASFFGGLALADGAALRRASPQIQTYAEVCNRVTLTPGPGGVDVVAPIGRYAIDADETTFTGGFDAAVAACAARGERVCTSDEWHLACVCTFPNESEGGPKVFANDRLVYRVESDQAGQSGPGAAEVHHLFARGSELVLPKVPGGGTLVAGPNDGVPDSWTADCRYRGLVTDHTLASDASSLISVRCCR